MIAREPVFSFVGDFAKFVSGNVFFVERDERRENHEGIPESIDLEGRVRVAGR